MHAVGDYKKKKLSASSYYLTAASVTQQYCFSIDNLRLVGTMLGVAERSIPDHVLLKNPIPYYCLITSFHMPCACLWLFYSFEGVCE